MFLTLLRFGAALAVAAVATFAVFWMMQSLISTGGSVLNENDFGRIESFVMSKPDDEVQTKERKPRKPPAAAKEPPKPDMPKPQIAKASTDGFDVGGFDMGAELSVDAGLSGGSGDGDFLPIVKVAPNYPRRAAQKGIEGYVVVEFTVTSLGTVIDPVVIEAAPPNIFDREAMAAVKKFKYKPKVEDGKAVAVTGVRNIIRFELEKNGR
ncbi:MULTISPECIES: energy transducer TonB [unclassified Oceanobacter]|jgi:protein TonB|uniref:energy transducer TonB n=1 Tax=unclassified Oceanobacter TaxID=2620260 RepID=UPI0026E2A175|nr:MULTISPECIES: energy transducer TonB [unclassified Oceanobacter]MDO6682599.1 energy transducer TonB [Oceanobacter sp. 5_MG-2023]MDP2506815.1 energy transducer TonB [Oceanobacter sp. 3_MG-2023]MDP2547876.1 energy transducer TonB [Oceanobacter sp. 4_MG-2023]MDP2608832.1 energy transducer TonB [Oceanobacter sp. 1_MG-2023]MDP2611926.1 energy transducer TonB [Oceanobacter sp. 2_MG-2023]